MPKLKNPFEHKIYLLISKDIVDLARLSLNNKSKGKIEVSPRQYFVVDIMYPIFEILEKLESLNYSSYLINFYPSSKKLRSKIKRGEYIIYHLEYYLISQISLFDRILHFCNVVYGLGLDDRHVTYDIIINNANVGKDCKKILKDFYSYLDRSEIRKTQNIIKHKEKLRDKKMDDAYFFEMGSMAANNLKNIEDVKDLERAASIAYKIYLTEKKEKINEEIEKLKEFTIKLFDIFYPIIENKYKKYHG